jgi:hypothetical protein
MDSNVRLLKNIQEGKQRNGHEIVISSNLQLHYGLRGTAITRFLLYRKADVRIELDISLTGIMQFGYGGSSRIVAYEVA